jgi:misacylated tRNA(Ala) deacylase
MTELLFRQDSYLREAPARVVSHTAEGGIVLDQSLFYPTGGGQPGDAGTLEWDDQSLSIATAVKADESNVAVIAAEPQALPPVGTEVLQRLDWPRRYNHMRMHTALHLLSVVLPLPVTGGALSADRGRLDFAMPEPPSDRDAVEQHLNTLVELDLPVTEDWITSDELDDNPELIKTLSVRPPRGAGHVRLVRIGQGETQVDLQPCGGTHVSRTSEIGLLRLGKIEKKGKQNRRVKLHFADG